MEKTQNKSNITEFEFLYDYILIEAVEAQQTSGGLVKPDQYDDKPELGTVVSVGKGRLLDNGTVVPLMVKPGDTILFGKYGPSPIRSNGKDYLIMREYDVMAVFHA